LVRVAVAVPAATIRDTPTLAVRGSLATDATVADASPQRSALPISTTCALRNATLLAALLSGSTLAPSVGAPLVARAVSVATALCPEHAAITAAARSLRAAAAASPAGCPPATLDPPLRETQSSYRAADSGSCRSRGRSQRPSGDGGDRSDKASQGCTPIGSCRYDAAETFEGKRFHSHDLPRGQPDSPDVAAPPLLQFCSLSNE
jgi:hypothetical protein